MRLVKMLGLSAVTALAIMAFVGAASASAASPEFVLGSGTFPVNFTSTSGAGTLETVEGTQVNCTADTDSGTIENSTDNKETVIFTGCTAFGFSCTNTTKAGEIVVGPMKSKLVYVFNAKGEKKVGVILYKGTFPPAQPPGGETLTTFTCGGFIPVTVRGALLGTYSTINKQSNTNNLVLNQTKGVQEYTEYENPLNAGERRKAFLESKSGGEFKQAGETTTDTLKLEGTRTVEIKG